MTPTERAAARAFLIERIPPGSTCSEVGVWKGDFSETIARSGRAKELHLIDPWRFAPAFPTRWYGGAQAHSQSDMDAIYTSVKARMAPYPMVTIHRTTSLTAALRFPDRHFDFVYIDGDHSYEAVLTDIWAWWPKLTASGSIVCDDYDWDDVRRAVGEFVRCRNATATVLQHGQCVLSIAEPLAH